MTAIRLIPLQLHGALEMLAGLLLMAAPFLLGFEPAGTVVAVAVGAVVVGVALSSAGTDPAGARPTLPVATHHALDHGLTLGLAGAAAVIAVDGDLVAGASLALIAALLLALTATTRYSLRG
ncbi:MAG TPA: hypothetical protein VD931_06715 [Baekduia sp.]|nr:hypothetical protein [Baekduia sp.]